MPGNMEEAMGFFTKGWLPNYEATYQNSRSQYELQASDHTQVTLDDIENNIYGVVNNTLFNDEASNWGHTMGLTHPYSEFMGFAISRYNNTLTFHMNPVNPAVISEPARFNLNDNVALDNSATIIALQARWTSPKPLRQPWMPLSKPLRAPRMLLLRIKAKSIV